MPRKGQNNEQKKEDVKKISLDNLVNKSKVKEEQALIFLHEDVEDFEFKPGVLSQNLFKWTNMPDLVDRVEEKLENTNQKNTFRSIVNGLATGQIRDIKEYEIAQALNTLFGENGNAQAFTAHMNKMATNEYEYCKNFPNKKNYIQQAIKYSSADAQKHEEEKNKKIENRHKESDIDRKKDAQEARMKDVKITSAPRISKDRAAWFRIMAEDAQAARGLLNDSPQYMELKSHLDAMRDISKVYYNAQKAGKESVRLSAFEFNGKVKMAQYAQNGVVTMESLKQAYEDTWKDIQKSALNYEKYKLDDSGFTRDARKKRGKKLDSSGKLKFKLIDKLLLRDVTAKEQEKANAKKSDGPAKSM